MASTGSSILLTTEQKNAPLLNAQFSTSRGILRQFITENEGQLFALTARDAVAGELDNSIYASKSRSSFSTSARSPWWPTRPVARWRRAGLTGLINRFKTEEGAWYDDVLIAEMIELAKQTGDLTRNPVALKDMTFAQGNFWTGHFGGLYIFREVEHPAAICTGPKDKLEPLPVPLIALTERTAIARFLQVNDLVEPIVEARGLDAASILHQKMDFIVAEVAATMGEDLSGATRRDMRGIARKYARLLPEEWQGLAALARWAEEGGPWPRITSEHPAFFYSLRAKPRGDADLVNMLLSELSPLDVRHCSSATRKRSIAPMRSGRRRSRPMSRTSCIGNTWSTRRASGKAFMGPPRRPCRCRRPCPGPGKARNGGRTDCGHRRPLGRRDTEGTLNAGLVRLALILLVGLTIIYVMLALYFRSLRKENLEKEWDEAPQSDAPGARDEFIAAGMAEYRGSLRRKLLLGVYVVPVVLIGVRHLSDEQQLKGGDDAPTALGLSRRAGVILVAFFSYVLPQHDVARVTGATIIRQDFSWYNRVFFAQADSGNVEGETRDIRLIETQRMRSYLFGFIRTGSEQTMVYRNEDTGWIWPPYFKFDSSDLQAEAGDFVSTAAEPRWVVVRHYGWRIPFLTIYPNATAIWPVEGPDVRTIPWFNILFFIFLGVVVGFVRLIWRQFRERTVDR